jgi:flagellar protein FliS
MPAYAPAPNAYRESAVLTASPAQLVVMLYDGANRFLTQSSIAMRDGRAGLAGEKLRRAEAIIDELLATLDMSVGEVAERLQALYLFFKEHLMSARLKQDAEKVDEVAGFMRELRASWATIAGA